MADDLSLAAELQRLSAGLETWTYYEFLGVEPACDYVGIRDAFHRRAERFHPDRFLTTGEALRETAYSVYKRIAEAYNVLIDPQLRTAYDRAVGEGRHRLSDVARARRLTAEERQVSHPLARVYMRAAFEKFKQGRLQGAWIDAKLGLSLEDVRAFRLLIDEIERDPRGAKWRGPRS